MRHFVIASVTAVAFGSALADETRQLGTHEHGVGLLDIAIEDQEIVMELRVPGADIVGFEHAATSDRDKLELEQALATLESPLELFVPPAAAGCTVSKAEVEVEAEDGDHHEHEEHGDAEADEHHGDHQHVVEDGGHREFHGSYTLVCADPVALTSVEMAYFEIFPNAHSLTIQLITVEGAQALEALREAPIVDLSGKL